MLSGSIHEDPGFTIRFRDSERRCIGERDCSRELCEPINDNQQIPVLSARARQGSRDIDSDALERRLCRKKRQYGSVSAQGNPLPSASVALLDEFVYVSGHVWPIIPMPHVGIHPPSARVS